MSCDHKLIADNVIDYIEGLLPSYIRKQCDEVLQNCQHCQQTVQKAHEISHLFMDKEPSADKKPSAH